MLKKFLNDGSVQLEPFEDRHLDGLRAACALDQAIWEIYPVCMIGDYFEPSFALFRSLPNWIGFAVIHDGDIVGMTHYIPVTGEQEAVEIGATYIAPAVRGGSVNHTMKSLMIEHAFDEGYSEIQFSIDTRNKRSIAAVEKLGADLIEILAENMTSRREIDLDRGGLYCAQGSHDGTV